MQLWEYPRPKNDNGRGVHWFTTQSASNSLVDTYIAECQAMHIKWVLFLNGFEWALLLNDYLVDRLFQNGMMPILRVLTHPTGALPNALPDLVRHYVGKGVRYFQIHNEPNLKGEWPNNNFPPDMMSKLVGWWCDAALKVIDAGGLPGFPGLATAGGEYGVGQGEDLKFFMDALDAINARLDANQRATLYDKLWISLHNYNIWGRDPITTDVTTQDSHCFKKFIIYDQVVRQKIGRSLPMLGTEGGTRLGITPNNPYTDTRDENVVADYTVRSFQYTMDQAPDYFLCFSPWVLGSKLAGNDDPFFEETAWYRANGTRQKVANAVKGMPSYARKFGWDQPAQVTFQADATSITQGQSTILRWTTQNVTSVTLDGVAVDLSGQRQVQPTSTTTYVLHAVPRLGAPLDKTVTIGVTAVPEPIQPTIIDVAAQLPQYPRGNAPVGPYPQRTLDKIAMIVIHHTAWDEATPEKLATYLVDQRHWPGIGYHFMIMKDGTIYQTNRLETVSFHTYDGLDPYTAPRNWDVQSVGVAFVGQFDQPNHNPTPQQMESSGKLCAWLLRKLSLTEDAIRGRCELMTDPSPNPSPGCSKIGTTWVWRWKDALLTEVRKYYAALPTVPSFYQYLLFWKHPDAWAREDWAGAQDYIQRFLPTCGFSVEEAKKYIHVSIVGGPFGVPEGDEQALRAAGCQVERLAGEGFEGTAGLLKRMAAEGRRFLNP